jgi:hypothetical protein
MTGCQFLESASGLATLANSGKSELAVNACFLIAWLSFGHKDYLLASRFPQRLTGLGAQYSVSTGTVSGITP